MITCQTLKQMAKADLKNGKSFIFKASLLFFALLVIFSLLLTYISGFDRFMVNLNNISAEIYSKPEMMLNPTEEFETEVFNELLAAFPKIAPAAVVLLAVILIFRGMLMAGFEGYCLKVSRGEEVKVLDIMRSFEHFGKVLALFILRTLIECVGYFFFLIPGIIARYAFSQCYMVLYDNPEHSVFRCLRESAKIMRGHKMMLFVLQFSFIFWHFADQLIMRFTRVALLKIYTLPFIGLSQAHFYNEIIAKDTPNNTGEAQ